jgi:hypothetical protein
MSLTANVIPGVLTVLATLIPANGQVPQEVTGGATGTTSAPILGMSLGPRFEVPVTPWCWVQNTSFSEADPQGSGLIATPWVMLCRLFMKYAPDQVNCERVLSGIIAPVRDAFRTNTMLAPQPPPNPIRRSYVSSGDWGYMYINDIPYRYVDLNISVEEKEALRYS